MKELRFLNVRFFGGGSGGGGGTSGQVDFPAYMKTVHNDWLDNTGSDTMSSSVTDAMNAAYGASPFAGMNAYDPATEVSNILGATVDLDTLVALLSSGTGLDTITASVLDDARIIADVNAFAADLDAQILTVVVPRFESGMRDINAVHSSAFVIGEAIIQDGRNRDVAKYDAELRDRLFSDTALKVIGMKFEFTRSVAQLVIEANRLSLVAGKEEVDANLKIDEADAKWDMEVFQYGSNVLASIHGGTAVTSKASPMASAIGGALAGGVAGALYGATEGAAVGSVPGAVIGAGLGLAMSLLQR